MISPDSKPISNEDLLELEVDVLYPVGPREASSLIKNAANIKARKSSCELANGPTTPEADKILFEKGVYVLPDFLANAGGVTVSYFEQVQNTYNYYWSKHLVQKRLDEKMTAAFHAVRDRMIQEKVHGRLAAYMVSVKRVADAVKGRGWV